MKMASLTKEDIRSVIETIKELYLEDMIPWICGYSGGKDSTAYNQEPVKYAAETRFESHRCPGTHRRT